LSAVGDADLEGIVAKRLADAYQPKLARWHKIINRTCSQRRGRAEWFRERRGRCRASGRRLNPKHLRQPGTCHVTHSSLQIGRVAARRDSPFIHVSQP
jgi:hypothetical protein